MVMDDFKFMFVNHKDKKGEGMQKVREVFDREGYSFWWIHY